MIFIVINDTTNIFIFVIVISLSRANNTIYNKINCYSINSSTVYNNYSNSIRY